METSFSIGKKGEEKAKAYLEDQGLTLIQKRLRIRDVEIDLLMQKDDTLIFVEVKATKRHSDSLYYRVNQQKMKRFIRAATNYIEMNQNSFQKSPFIRFDVVLVSDAGVYHIENAFLESDLYHASENHE